MKGRASALNNFMKRFENILKILFTDKNQLVYIFCLLISCKNLSRNLSVSQKYNNDKMKFKLDHYC